MDTDRLNRYRQRLVELQVRRPRNWKTEARKLTRAIVSMEAIPGASDGNE